MKLKVALILVAVLVIFDSKSQIVHVKTRQLSLRSPIDTSIVLKAIQLVNQVYASNDFKTELEKNSFVYSNRPELCDSSNVITGTAVYDDFIRYDTITINFIVKRVGIKFWKRTFSHTLGETDPNDNTIITYTYWLDDSDQKELIINYATHIGHEIFHTKYYKYLHDPAYGTKDFVNDKDVTYKIDDIIEAQIRKNYH